MLLSSFPTKSEQCAIFVDFVFCFPSLELFVVVVVVFLVGLW